MLAAERYKQAISVDDYLDQMTQNHDRCIGNIEGTEISDEDRKFFSEHPLRVLILTEEWCIDSTQFVPVLTRLSREVPDMQIRVLKRDEHKDLATNYRRKDGYQAIPVFIFFDESMREIGFLIERPAQVTEEMIAETRRFQQAHPELEGITRTFDKMPEETRAAVKENSSVWRTDRQDRFARYFLDEVTELVQHAFEKQTV